jgi:para-aminobenzoate synthetase / 4-amino-4-deoxychorismate lyase
MERLAASATYFSFKLDEAEVLSALERDAVSQDKDRLRVRLLLAEDGRVTVSSTPLQPPVKDAKMRYAVSPTRLDSADTFLFHKTTRRELYDQEWKHYSETVGADEVVYLNERGELAEGSRTNIFIERGGKLLTPPLASGLLPGVLRSELLASGKAEEAVLTAGDLVSGATVYLGNSVRGLVPAEPVKVSV